MASKDDDWSTLLKDHPIFSQPRGAAHAFSELSALTLPKFTNLNPQQDEPTAPGRRQTMIIKDTELIVAVGKELRVTALNDTKLNQGTRKSHKVLHTPNVQFEIQQIALNPSGKLLAVAGAFQLAVVVLPRPGFMRLVPTTIDCKSIQIGQFYHGSPTAPSIAKIQWHPWGEAGSTLMVMTVDGKLRDYDISVDTEEPAQVTSFAPERRSSKTFRAYDSADSEAVSFTFGKGRADWGPLTVYVLMKGGDVYAVCPYLPQNAWIPSSYLHTLDCFVLAKQDRIPGGASADAQKLSVMYDYQRKYMNALQKQLPPGTDFPSASRSVLLHPPATMQKPLKQGPFLFRPEPRILEGSEGGDATDIVYLSFGNEVDRDPDGETERLGLVLIATQDGKVDICLDVEKIEARWEARRPDEELPMMVVYETVDLGLVGLLSASAPPLLDLLQANHPVFHADPIHDDTVYVYHAFGVHLLNLERTLASLGAALRPEDDTGASLMAAVERSHPADVRPIVSTFSMQRKASNPVVAVAMPHDVYLASSIFVLTSALRFFSFPLMVRATAPESQLARIVPAAIQPAPRQFLSPLSGSPAYVSLLGSEPFVVPPAFSRLERPTLPPSQRSQELRVTPETLRFLGQIVADFATRIRNVQFAYKAVVSQADLQKAEHARQQEKLREMRALVQQLKGPRQLATEARVKTLRSAQDALLTRLDRVLQAMTKSANPELSDQEKKWFDELKRMRVEVLGAGRQDADALRARMLLLQREFARIMLLLQSLKERQSGATRGVNHGLGVSQAFEFGQQFNKERTNIQKMEKDVVGLAKTLELSLNRPPSLSSQTWAVR